MKPTKNEDILFVFTVNDYNEIVLRETRIAIVNESTVVVEAYGEYKKENVYMSNTEAFRALIKRLKSMKNEVDLPLSLKI